MQKQIGWVPFIFWMLTLLSVSSLSAAEQIKVGGTGSAIGTMYAVVAAFQQTRPDVDVQIIPALGSGGGIKAVAAGVLNIGLSGRVMKPSERALNLNQFELARTPFVFASQTFHPGLSLGQITKIYAGTQTTWPDGSVIRLILRPESDSETTLLRGLSPEMNRAIDAAQARPGLHTALTDPDMADALEKVPGAFGSSTLALILSEHRRIKAIPMDKVVPSLDTLAKGAYPYYKPLYLVTSAVESPATRDLIAFMRSKAGVKVLAQNGFLAID